MAAHKRVKGRRDEEETIDGRIVWIEVLGYTAVILLIAMLATGWFDVMMPWK